MKVGVLALQGDFERHEARLREFGVKSALVRTSAELSQLAGIVLPGGESSTMLRLMNDDLRRSLIEEIGRGLPCFSTCAGTILLARRVENPEQESLGLVNIDVRRNAYGRQVNSFIAPLSWSPGQEPSALSTPVEGVFIRAPKITRVGDNVEVLLTSGSDPVLVRYRKIFCATFHPELSEQSKAVHELFLKAI